MIGGRKRKQTDIFISSCSQSVFDDLQDFLNCSFAYRTVDHTSMAESAAAGAAAHDLDREAVMDRLHIGDNQAGWVRRKFGNNPLGYDSWNRRV